MNQHGLSRDIPAAVKRAVRQRDGFGCVVCGQAVIEYEHFDPDFRDAKQHDVNGIILLCISCHGRKTRGLLSRETIKRHSLAPKARQAGFSHGAFDVGEECPDVMVGNILFQHTPVLLEVLGDELFSVKEPEQTGGPFRLSAYLTDHTGRLLLKIVDNEWISPVSNWDVTVVGQRISIRSGIRDIEMVLRTNPPNLLVVETLKMAHKNFSIDCVQGQPTVIRAGLNTMTTYAATLNGCQVGIRVVDDEILCIGVGGGGMSINSDFGELPGSQLIKDSNVLPFIRK